jgi:hypothetical protein
VREVGTLPSRSILSGQYHVQFDQPHARIVDIAVVLECKETWAPASNAKSPNIPCKLVRVLLDATLTSVHDIELACKNRSVADGLPTVFMTEEVFLSKFQIPQHAFDGVFKVDNPSRRRLLLSPMMIQAGVVQHMKVVTSLLNHIETTFPFSNLVTHISSQLSTYPSYYSVAALICAATNFHLEPAIPPIGHNFLGRLELTINTKYPGLLAVAVLPTKRVRVAGDKYSD